MSVAVSTMLALTACGGPSKNVELEEGSKNLDASLDVLEQTGAENSLDDATPEQLRCVEDRGLASGIDPGDALRPEVSLETQEGITRILHECIPNLREMESYLASAAKAIDLGVGDGATTSTAEVTCILDHIWAESDDPVRTFVRGDQPGDDLILGGAFERCLPERLDAVLHDGGYGDDAQLDALQDGCEAGDDRACDLLYLLSAEGSGYDAIALDCAGRGVGSNEACSPEVNIDFETGFAPIDDPGVRSLVEDCRNGDWLACDLAYQLASNQDPLAHVAFTCGERLAVGGLPNCRAAMADS